MKLEFERVEAPYVFKLENENGVQCLMDASEAIGGKNKGFRPMELLAGSLAGCAAIDLISILKKQKTDPSHFAIEIEGKRSELPPSVFEWIVLNIYVDDTIDRERLARNVELVLKKYCSVAASLNENIRIQYTINEKG